MSIHQRHLQCLALEVFESLMHLNPEFMWSYFNENPIPYDLRKRTKVFLPPVKSFRLGLNSVHYSGSIPCNYLSSSIKNSQTINEFKAKLKNLGNSHFLLFPKYLFIYSYVLIIWFLDASCSSHCAMDISSLIFSL